MAREPRERGIRFDVMRPSAIRAFALLLLCFVLISACNGTASTPAVGRGEAATKYLAVATAYNDARDATLAKYAGDLTQAENQTLGSELADEERSFGDAIRAIEFPSEAADDVKLLLQQQSALEVLYGIAATATTVSDNKAAWDEVAQAELGVSQAANTVRADLGLPSVPITTPAPATAAPSAPNDAGVITFGTASNPATLLITKSATRFKTTYPRICFSASLTEAAGASSLKMVMGRLSSGGSEVQVWSTTVAISNPKADLIADCPDLTLAAGHKAATYAVRFLRGGTVLAEGTFSLVK